MLVRTRLREFRTLRAISAAELARLAGVSRQTIYAIEDGSFVPNTTVSLQLARALHVGVEELFSLADDQAAESVEAQLLASGEVAEEGQLVRVCRVNNRLVAALISAMPAYLPVADGVVEQRKKSAVAVKTPTGVPEGRLLVAGCDPALSLLNQLLVSSGIEIVAVPCSSRRALDWLRRGRVHAAGSHILDKASGDYNLPIIRRLFPAGAVRVITFAVWEQGLVLQRGNPKSIRTVADLGSKNISVINREKGSGSRDLLDSSFRKVGIHGEQVKGYSSVAAGHLAAAYAVAAGTADCCVAPRSAARCFGLDFVPLAVERFDLSLAAASLELPAAKALMDALNRSDLRKKLESIAGYDTRHTGEVLI